MILLMKEAGLKFFSLLFIFILGWGQTQFISDRHTIALWHFNEGEGDSLYDSSGNRHHGQIKGALWDSFGISGSCLSFDGKDDYIEVLTATDLIPPREISLELWLKTPAYPPVHYAFLSKSDNYHGGSGYLWGVDNNGKYKCYFKVTDWKFSTANIPLDTWTYLAVTIGSGMLRYYINGYETDCFTCPADDLINNAFNLIIGRTENTNTYFLNGYLDEIRISSVARDPGEIKQNWLNITRDAGRISAIYLKNGDRISGTITRPVNINVETDYGMLIIPIADITGIVFGSKSKPDLTIAGSSRIAGRIAVDTFIVHGSLGEVHVQKNQITKIER